MCVQLQICIYFNIFTYVNLCIQKNVYMRISTKTQETAQKPSGELCSVAAAPCFSGCPGT